VAGPGGVGVSMGGNVRDEVSVTVGVELGNNVFVGVWVKEEVGDELDVKEILKVEEKRHYELLENTHRFLEDTGDWFMWEEHGILEG